MHKKTGGFTLLELSIVLLIIALIVGGVLMGRDLVLAAQQRHIHKEFSSIVLAYNVFTEKYQCLPGDCLGTQLGLQADGNANGAHDLGDIEPLSHLQQSGLVRNMEFVNNLCDDSYSLLNANFTGAVYAGYEHLGRKLVFHCATYRVAEFGFCTGLAQYDRKFDDGEPESGSIYMSNEESLNDVGTVYCVNDATNPTYNIGQLPPYSGFTSIFYRIPR